MATLFGLYQVMTKGGALDVNLMDLPGGITILTAAVASGKPVPVSVGGKALKAGLKVTELSSGGF
jgi:hypothetical protein